MLLLVLNAFSHTIHTPTIEPNCCKCEIEYMQQEILLAYLTLHLSFDLTTCKLVLVFRRVHPMGGVQLGITL